MKKILLRITALRPITLAVGVFIMIGATYDECHADYVKDALQCKSRLEWCIKGTGTGKGCGELSYLTRDGGADKTATQHCENLKPSIGLEAACKESLPILKSKNLCDWDGVSCLALETSCISFFRDKSGKNPCDMYKEKVKEKCLATLEKVKENIGPKGSWRYICPYFANDAIKREKMCE